MQPAAPPAPPAPGGAAPQPGGGIDPRASLLAYLGAKSSIAGLGDTFKPFETALYNSPTYKAAVAAAEAAGKLPYVGPTAAAEAAGKLPFTQDTVRPGSIHTMGGKPDFAAPVQVDAVDPATGRTYKTWTSPPLPGQNPGQSSMAPGPQAALTAPGVPGGEMTRLGPGEETERKAIGETLGDEYKNSVAAYQHAQGTLPALSTVANAMQSFRTGQFAGDRLRLGQAWQDFAGTVGLKPDSELAKWISSGEIINKEGTRLGYELARTLGSREAQMIVQQAIASNPGLYNSPQGNEKLIGLIQQGLQQDVDRRNFYDNWLSPNSGHGGTLAGAATAFDKAKPADFYVSQVLPMHPKSPADLKKLAPGTRYTRPGNDSMVYTIPEQ
jgi:hypothetical protein